MELALGEGCVGGGGGEGGGSNRGIVHITWEDLQLELIGHVVTCGDMWHATTCVHNMSDHAVMHVEPV